MADTIRRLRARTIYHLARSQAVGDGPGTATYAAAVSDDPGVVEVRHLTIDGDMFNDLGRPALITVTIEPGDALNDLANASLREGWARDDVIYQVIEARRNGKSWADIGRAFGITRQAAWERFAHLMPEADLIHRHP